MKLEPCRTDKIHFDEEIHAYRVNGEIKYSVGQLLKLCGIEKDIDSLPEIQQENIRRAGKLGKSVHAWTEIEDKGEFSLYEPPEARELAYLNAWRKFKAESKAKIIEIEGAHFSEYGNYCGRLDRVAVIGCQLYVIDIKTAKKVNKNARLQLMGYCYFFKNEMKRMVVQLCEDGSYVIYDDGKYGKNWLDDAVDRKKWEAVLEVTSWIRNNGR